MVAPLQGLINAPLIGMLTFTTEAAALTATNSKSANRYGASIFRLFIVSFLLLDSISRSIQGAETSWVGSRRGIGPLDALSGLRTKTSGNQLRAGLNQGFFAGKS